MTHSKAVKGVQQVLHKLLGILCIVSPSVFARLSPPAFAVRIIILPQASRNQT